MDDVFAVIDSHDVHSFLDHLNSIETSIEFTFEVEEGGSLPFLDTEVVRGSDGSLSTRVYRKRTHTDKYLHFSTHHPLGQKCTVACTLLLRAQKLCPDLSNRSEEERHITSPLEDDGYPRCFIHQSLH